MGRVPLALGSFNGAEAHSTYLRWTILRSNVWRRRVEKEKRGGEGKEEIKWEKTELVLSEREKSLIPL